MTDSRDPFSGAAPALGYLYQARWALLDSVRRAGRNLKQVVILEGLDDVEFGEDEPRILIQTKHRITSRPDLTDSSSALWKTLRVWLDRDDSGQIVLSDTLLHLVTTAPVPAGSAASLLQPADRDIAKAVRQLTRVAEASGAAANQSAYDLFLARDERERGEFLDRIYVLSEQPSIRAVREELEAELRLSVRVDFLVPLVDRLEGWWFRQVVSCLSGPATPIPLLELEDHIHRLREQFTRDSLPIDFDDLSIEELSPEDEQKAFVEQLRLINVGPKSILNAVLDYYKAYRQRSRWLKEGLLLPGELATYENRLLVEWQRYFDFAGEDLSPEAVEEEKVRIGRQIYKWAAFEAELPIRRDCSEAYVWRGSFQMLADRGATGWHPNFRVRLAELFERAVS